MNGPWKDMQGFVERPDPALWMELSISKIIPVIYKYRRIDLCLVCSIWL